MKQNNKLDVSEEAFMRYVESIYNSEDCVDDDELLEDLNKILYIKRIFNRYIKNQEIDKKTLRLCLNHIIVLTNVFGPAGASNILFYKLDANHYSILRTFLQYINCMPTKVSNIEIENISIDYTLFKKLKDL